MACGIDLVDYLIESGNQWWWLPWGVLDYNKLPKCVILLPKWVILLHTQMSNNLWKMQ